MVATQSILNLQILTIEQAENWITATLSEADALRQHSAELFPSRDDPASLEAARQLHKIWSEWADGADLLANRLKAVHGVSSIKERLTELFHAVGRVRARLSITPDSYLDGLKEIDAGKVISHEEVKREFRNQMERRCLGHIHGPIGGRLLLYQVGVRSIEETS